MDCVKHCFGAPLDEKSACHSLHPLGLSDSGVELSMQDAVARSHACGPFFVLETYVKDSRGRIPLPGQTALTVYHHLACGAAGVTYCGNFPDRIRIELEDLQRQLAPTLSRALLAQKTTRIAILAEASHPRLHWLFDTLYRLNLEADVLPAACRDFGGYDFLIVTNLGDDSLAYALRAFVAGGGNLLSLSGAEGMPPEMQMVFGITCEESTLPEGITVAGRDLPVRERLDVLHLTTAQSVAVYDGPGWKGVPALTLNRFGGGTAAYLGCYVPENFEGLLLQLFRHWCMCVPDAHWPLVVKQGRNSQGNTVIYIMNYSAEVQSLACPGSGTALLSGKVIHEGQPMILQPWEVQILEVTP